MVVEADDHERPTIFDLGDRCCTWRPSRGTRHRGDGVGGQTLAIELTVPDRERECDEVPALVADVIALPAHVIGDRIQELIDRHQTTVDLTLEHTELPVVL